MSNATANSTTFHCWPPLSSVQSVITTLLYLLLISISLSFWVHILDVSIRNVSGYAVLIVSHKVSWSERLECVGVYKISVVSRNLILFSWVFLEITTSTRPYKLCPVALTMIELGNLLIYYILIQLHLFQFMDNAYQLPNLFQYRLSSFILSQSLLEHSY